MGMVHTSGADTLVLRESSRTRNIQHWSFRFSMVSDTIGIGCLFTACVCRASKRYFGHYSLGILYLVAGMKNIISI